ncbi:hypothetical protein FIA58_000235 [Flavobacterium jejuense]|uniref:Immunity MXAN-0049 protein domain-containing protein n=1 Tax=Flavobacterium jejuense TaxID=1544455 RepID=A0ABX0IJT7_9FLAO|nr:DUF1629 domain-containing protein [Flavobacterium jejuense]NHN24089.1 hypothetical protein [Flavobacterium jejuense]
MIDAFVPKIVLTLNNDSRKGNMTDHLSIDEACDLVFSKRLRDLLQNIAVDNIQYFDLDIVDPKTNNIYTDYKIANVVGLVDCVDKNESDLKYFNSVKDAVVNAGITGCVFYKVEEYH